MAVIWVAFRHIICLILVVLAGFRCCPAHRWRHIAINDVEAVKALVGRIDHRLPLLFCF